MKGRLPSAEFTLAGKTLLVTGATGFLAKVFLEKLLRTCPDVQTIYLLVRAPSQREAEDRLQKEILYSPLFMNLTASRDCLRAIPGDTTLPRLGLAAEDYIRLLTEVDFVVNSAASTDFRQPIQDAIRTNTVSVGNIIEFIKSCGGARLLHISTCYVNENGTGAAPEAICPQPRDADHQLPESSEEIFAMLEAELDHADGVEAGWEFAKRHGWNNVYTFGKWLGEKLLLENIPCTILRPSIIESCIYGPISGWIEGFKVADPLFYAGGKDIVKIFPGDESAIMDVIPVDMVAGAMILCLNELAYAPPAVRFYHASSSVENPVTLKSITRIIRGAFGNGHLQRPFFVPAWLFFSIFGLVYTLQRFLLKLMSPLLGQEATSPLRTMIKDTEKLLYFAKLYQPYSSLKRTFESRELKALHSRAAAADRLRFPVDSARINWTEYLAGTHIPGLQKFVLTQRIKA